MVTVSEDPVVADETMHLCFGRRMRTVCEAARISNKAGTLQLFSGGLVRAHLGKLPGYPLPERSRYQASGTRGTPSTRSQCWSSAAPVVRAQKRRSTTMQGGLPGMVEEGGFLGDGLSDESAVRKAGQESPESAVIGTTGHRCG